MRLPTVAVHYLDNALLGVHGLGKVCLGGVWLVHVCNIALLSR